MKTNEDLLQQAKDQVAQETWDDGLNRFFNDWDDFINNNPWSTHRQFHLLNNAAELAIQSAREEGIYTDFNYDIVAANIREESTLLTKEEAEPALSKEKFFQLIGASWDHADANVIWDTLEHYKYKIQKLTAPGR